MGCDINSVGLQPIVVLVKNLSSDPVPRATIASRILVVDDEAMLCQAVSRMLRQIGHLVDYAPDGGSALRMAAQTRYDVALVDYDMPGGLDGLAALAALRDIQPSCMRVLMTGRGDFPMIVQAVNRGEVVRVLPKPFEPGMLEATVSDALLLSHRHAAIDDTLRGHQTVERMLDEALTKDLVRMAVQPIVRTQAPFPPFAVECLLRPTHSVLGTPLALLRAAERVKRIHDLGKLVNLRSAEWAVALPEEILIFVNLHPEQLASPDLMEAFAPLLPHAKRIVLEITERTHLSRVSNWDGAIATLGEAGFQFAVDDLGSGHNGLALLAELKPAFIKVDISIVRNVDKEQRKQRLVALLADFANATGAKLVAEGVETEAESKTLAGCGAHLLQGYFFGRPSLEWNFGPHASPVPEASRPAKTPDSRRQASSPNLVV